MNYEQLTSLFRVEERSVAYVVATLVNVIITVVATILLVAVWHKGAIGVLVGNFTGTLVVYFVLLAYRRFQLGSSSTATSSGGCSASACRSCRPGSRSGSIDLSDRFFLIRITVFARSASTRSASASRRRCCCC